MSTATAQAVICGAGIAGIAAAYHLARRGMGDVVLVDEHPPLSLTSDKSTECYRNWWPGPDQTMISLMNRSIDLMERRAAETDNRFLLNRRGYLYATADRDRIDQFRRAAEEAAAGGAGPLRIHDHANAPYEPAPAHGYAGQPTGADLILDQALIRRYFPYLSETTVAVIHARRAGWFSAQQLGMYLLEQAREHGVRLVRGQVEQVDLRGGRVEGVRLSGDDAPRAIATDVFVNAAGPRLRAVGRMLGVELPVFSELHLKLAINDHQGVVPRDAPMLIWADPTPLGWSDEERELLQAADEPGWLLDTLPSGVHARPEGGPGSSTLLILWGYHNAAVPETFPLPSDEHFPEVALRGMAAMIPGLRAYVERAPRPTVDGGYYTKTKENRPLIGPLPIAGAYVLGALSGYGLMAACAAGELLATHVVGGELPEYAPALALARYDDPGYRALLERWDDAGQL